MQFRQIPEILAGTKTQTRRVCKQGEDFVDLTDAAQWVDDANGRLKWMIGRTYAVVPKRGQKAIADGRIRITDIRQERLHDITEADARAEGVASVEEYRALWESLHGRNPRCRWNSNPLVWVIQFEMEKS